MKDKTTVKDWRSLCKVGALAALAVVILVPVQGAVYVLNPPPDSVRGWFALFEKNALVGLLDMDLLLIADWLLFAVLFLALWAVLKEISPSLMALSLVLELLAVAIYMSSTAAFEMLSLSSGYASATTDAERSIYLAAGQAMLAVWQGTSFNVSYVLAGLSFLLVSVVMLRSPAFGRFTAGTGIGGGILMLVPPTVGTVGFVMSFLSLIPMLIWLAIVGHKLWWRVGRA